MWGQGLKENQKFAFLVADWLRRNNLEKRDVQLFNMAVSGAIIGNGPGSPEHRPSVAESWWGEIPRSSPTLRRQMDLVTDRHKVQPADVDLVLVSGGANDVKFFETLIDPSIDEAGVRRRIDEFMGARMERFLPDLLNRFSNSKTKVIVTGYFAGITSDTSRAEVAALLATFGFKVGGITGSVGGIVLSQALYDMLVRKNRVFVEHSINVLKNIVQTKGLGRTFFVSPDFAPMHGFMASYPFVFSLAGDSLQQERAATCRRLDQGAIICDNASVFHPNAAGAHQYAQRIIARLTGISPGWAGQKFLLLELRVTAEEKDSYTIIVTARDCNTGSPANGVVEINGVKGVTGTPVTFRRFKQKVVTGGTEDFDPTGRSGPPRSRARCGRAGPRNIRVPSPRQDTRRRNSPFDEAWPRGPGAGARARTRASRPLTMKGAQS